MYGCKLHCNSSAGDERKGEHAADFILTQIIVHLLPGYMIGSTRYLLRGHQIDPTEVRGSDRCSMKVKLLDDENLARVEQGALVCSQMRHQKTIFKIAILAQ